MKIKGFKAWRPDQKFVKDVASVPYDVVDYDEAILLSKNNPKSFLNVVRADINFPKSNNPYSEEVYKKAKSNLQSLINDNTLIQEKRDSIYLYSQKFNDHIQYGIVATCHIEDYESGIIKIHEKTRKAKELDRVKYIESQNAHTGPVFLAYRDSKKINDYVNDLKLKTPLYHFIADDHVEHTLWKFNDNSEIIDEFNKIPNAYVADGHHRSASAVKVGIDRRNQNSNHNGEELYNYFLAVLFPESELKILPYNRVVLSMNISIDEFRSLLVKDFVIEANGVDTPRKSGEICMFIEGAWNTLTLRNKKISSDPVMKLDVSILQDYILSPILGIDDPRESANIDFIGGIKGTKELEDWVNQKKAVIAFSLYPTSMNDLFNVADAGKLMPPKSTWFEPKLRSGLLVNIFE
tara:strand:+ start:1070 stop:2290 length:1221 start_codon:yes stop_codon:yes gene_type:complete